MDIEKLEREAYREAESIENLKELKEFEIKYLGRKGKLTSVLRSLKDFSVSDRRNLGPKAQKLKRDLEEFVKFKLKEVQVESVPEIDITRPGKKPTLGQLHPLTKVQNDIREIFSAMNFSVIDGPEVETEHYNFDALNIPPDHPARDAWDTFWLKEPENPKSKIQNPKLLLRTHTSPMQVRFMETHEPPFQIIVPGRTFRYEATDASHEVNFYQLEGLMVGKNISLANFKYVIETFFKKFFKRDIEFLFRPSYFPFTEPSVEVDIKMGSGKWLEMMGAGMVHPNVFEAAHLNPRDWQGFAFGCGIDRLAMIKYGIPDIRLFYLGDLRFTKQFKK